MRWHRWRGETKPNPQTPDQPSDEPNAHIVNLFDSKAKIAG